MTRKTKTNKKYIVCVNKNHKKCVICGKVLGGEGKGNKYPLCSNCYHRVLNFRVRKTTENYVKNIVKILEDCKINNKKWIISYLKANYTDNFEDMKKSIKKLIEELEDE